MGRARSSGVLGFVAPLRHPATASSYESVCDNLATTLHSLVRQQTPGWRAVIVGNRAPHWPMPDGVDFIEVDLEPTYTHPARPSSQNQVTFDKGTKIAIGMARLRSMGVTHIMPFDADDLLHRGLSGLVRSQPEAPGWYSNTGFIHVQRTRLLWKIEHGFHQRNGSSHIIRADLVPLPDDLPEEPTPRVVIERVGPRILSMVIGKHSRWTKWAADNGHPLLELPFPSAVWVVGTGENQSRVAHHRGPRCAIDRTLAESFDLSNPPWSQHVARRAQTLALRIGRRLPERPVRLSGRPVAEQTATRKPAS